MPQVELTLSPKGNGAPLSITASWIASIKCKTWAGTAAVLLLTRYPEDQITKQALSYCRVPPIAGDTGRHSRDAGLSVVHRSRGHEAQTMQGQKAKARFQAA